MHRRSLQKKNLTPKSHYFFSNGSNYTSFLTIQTKVHITKKTTSNGQNNESVWLLLQRSQRAIYILGFLPHIGSN